MNFIVTYRAGNGALREERIEAASRAECVAECKRRGIAPIKIAEGGGRAVSTKPPRGDGRTKPGMWRAAVLTAVLAAVAGGAWWWYGHAGRVTLPAAREDTCPPKAEKPKAAEKPQKPRRTEQATAETASRSDARPPKKKPIDDGHYREDFHTNMYGYVINPPSTPVVFTNGPDVASMSIGEKVFRNTAEQKIADLLTMELGETLVGDASSLYGRGFVRQLVKAAENPPAIEEDDTDEVKELKLAVREATQDLKKRLDAGEDVGAAMKSLRDEMQNLALYRKDLEKEVAKIARRGDITEDDLKDFVAAANQMLSERGAKPITMPRFAVRRMQRLGRAAAGDGK